MIPVRVSKFRRVSNCGITKAFFTVELKVALDEKTLVPIEINDCQIKDGKNGLWFEFPSKKGKGDKWFKTVFVDWKFEEGKRLIDEITRVALQEFNGGDDSLGYEDDVPF